MSSPIGSGGLVDGCLIVDQETQSREVHRYRITYNSAGSSPEHLGDGTRRDDKWAGGEEATETEQVVEGGDVEFIVM